MPRSSAVIALALILGLTGCSDKTPDSAADVASYVAIGDSAVSGPEIAPPDRAAPPECFRSGSNYPHLVADALDVSEFVDGSCGGATTDTARHTLKNGKTQLDALGSKIELVTVGIGANDADFAGTWFTHCFLEGRSDEACKTFATQQAPTLLAQTRERVVTVLTEVKRRAPEARVLLVGYLRFAPDQGACDVLPISEANRAVSFDIEIELAAMLRAAATEAGVEFVDMRTVAEGHDICAGDDAWVNGLRSGDGSFLHPKSTGMEAVANEVLRTLREEQV